MINFNSILTFLLTIMKIKLTFLLQKIRNGRTAYNENNTKTLAAINVSNIFIRQTNYKHPRWYSC